MRSPSANKQNYSECPSARNIADCRRWHSWPRMQTMFGQRLERHLQATATVALLFIYIAYPVESAVLGALSPSSITSQPFGANSSYPLPPTSLKQTVTPSCERDCTSKSKFLAEHSNQTSSYLQSVRAGKIRLKRDTEKPNSLVELAGQDASYNGIHRNGIVKREIIDAKQEHFEKTVMTSKHKHKQCHHAAVKKCGTRLVQANRLLKYTSMFPNDIHNQQPISILCYMRKAFFDCLKHETTEKKRTKCDKKIQNKSKITKLQNELANIIWDTRVCIDIKS